jgi:hypothetical protein
MILSGIAYPFKVMSIHKGKCIINGGPHLVTAQQKNKLNLWMEQSEKTLKLIYYNNNNVIVKIITISANPPQPHIFCAMQKKLLDIESQIIILGYHQLRISVSKTLILTGGIHTMETEKFAKQMIDFQKATFDNTFTALTMLQDQAERMVNTVIDQATWLPEESRRVIDEMAGAFKKGRTDFKGAIDENFMKMADLF